MSLPYDYYPAVLYALNLLGQGRTLTSSCDEANISVQTFREYVKRQPELQAMYEDAVQRGNDAMVDALIEIDNHKIHGRSDPKMAKVVSDNIKWALSKRDPKNYGDRVEVKHTVTLDRVITNALENARKRTVDVIEMQKQEDGSFVDVTPVLDTDIRDLIG